MRKLMFAAAAAFAMTGLVACTESAADKKAETTADQLEAQAAATPSESQETALNAEADRVEQQAGNVDGGATTANTPSTSPSTGTAPTH